jgi:hypothetical protein
MLSIFKKKPRHIRAPKEMEKRVNEVISILLNDTEFKFTPFETALILTRAAAKLDQHLVDQADRELKDAEVAKKQAEEFLYARQTIQAFPTFITEHNG